MRPDAHVGQSKKKEITLDMCDPSTCLGAFSDFVVSDPRGIRSENPTHSMMVFGDRERALEFIKDEPQLSSGTAPNSCYGKIYDQGGYILLVGVAHNRNTYIHCVDQILGIPNRMNPTPRTVVVKRESGEIISKPFHTTHSSITKNISKRFPKYETAFRYHGAITDGYIGNAPTQACDARIMKETIELIFKNCEWEDPLIDEEAIPPKWYC